MSKFEVRVTQHHIDYYHVEAENINDAKKKVKQYLENKQTRFVLKVDHLKHTPKIDYLVKLTPDGEPII